MKRVMAALRMFFGTLFGSVSPETLQSLTMANPATIEPDRDSTSNDKSISGAMPVESSPTRGDAVSLLATLQREARFVDLVQEPLDGYTDAQVGAAARDVLASCAKVLHRTFQLEPVCDQQEGNDVQTPPVHDPGVFQLTGKVTGQAPFQGKLVHPGWKANRCDLPQWSGSKDAAMVVAPAELEMP